MIDKTLSFTKDEANRKMITVRQFEASVGQVWKAWTESAWLDQWWAPKPWKARTRSMDFRNGGHWVYAMVGPDGTTAWCDVTFTEIVPEKSFRAVSKFIDESGATIAGMPVTYWSNTFSPVTGGSEVKSEISFDSFEEMEKLLAMGFREGFTSALTNLDGLSIS